MKTQNKLTNDGSAQLLLSNPIFTQKITKIKEEKKDEQQQKQTISKNLQQQQNNQQQQTQCKCNPYRVGKTILNDYGRILS